MQNTAVHAPITFEEIVIVMNIIVIVTVTVTVTVMVMVMVMVKEDHAGIPIRPARNYRLSGVKFSLRASACGWKIHIFRSLFLHIHDE